MNTDARPPVEFSRSVSVESLPAGGKHWAIEASPDECERLAQRFGILKVVSVTAKFKGKPMAHGDIVRITGSLTAQVVQACVSSLVPVEQQVIEDIDMSFSPSAADTADDIDIDLSLDDPPDPIYDGKVDLGEIAAEHLALGLDPFPRADNAESLVGSVVCEDIVEKRRSPFAVLEALNKKKSSKP